MLAFQNLRMEKEGHRWVAIPTEQWQWMETTHGSLGWGLTELPAYIYSDTHEDLRVKIRMQTVHINIGRVNWIPTFVGYLMFLSVISLLHDEEREPLLLRPLAMLLWAGLDPHHLRSAAFYAGRMIDTK